MDLPILEEEIGNLKSIGYSQKNKAGSEMALLFYYLKTCVKQIPHQIYPPEIPSFPYEY
jgi:hypothetical protein